MKFSNKIKQWIGLDGHNEADSLDNAVDNRDNAVRLIVASLKRATSSRSDSLTSMTIAVIVPTEEYDAVDFSWADDRLLSDLRLALDNALLDHVGCRSMNLAFLTEDKLPASAREVVAGQLYLLWGDSQKSTANNSGDSESSRDATIEILAGTVGSTSKPVYNLSAAEDGRVYNIGRGAVGRTARGGMRRNEIEVRDDDPIADNDMANKRVSSCHADIVVKQGRFYLRAAAGGCRAAGGASTRIVRGQTVVELTDMNAMYPLADDDVICLGKSVNLHYKVI